MKPLGLYAIFTAGLAVAGLDLAIDQLQAGQAPEKEPSTEELVSRLNSSSFQERETAAKTLRAFGSKAVPALNAGLTGRSPEGVQRCKRLLADIRKDELDRFVKAFEADKDRKAKFDHPVWLRWAKVAGDDRPSRELLTEILAVTGAAEALDQLEADPKVAGALYPAELARLRAIAAPRSLGPDGQESWVLSLCYSVGEAMYGVYLGTYTGATSIKADHAVRGLPIDPEMEVLDSVTHIHYQKRGPWSKEAVKEGKYQRANLPLDGPKNRIIAASLLNLKNPRAVVHGLQWLDGGLRNADLNVCLPLARMVCREKAFAIEVRAVSWTYLAEAGESEFLSDIAAGQSDSKLVQQFWRSDEGKREYRVLVSDVSIAAQLLMHKQELKDFGFFEKLNEGRRAVDRSCFSFGFPDDATRKAAHAKAIAFLAKATVPKPKAPK